MVEVTAARQYQGLIRNLRENIEQLDLSEPEINLDAETEAYCRTLSHVPAAERRSRLHANVRPQVLTKLKNWQVRLSPCRKLLQHLHAAVEQVVQDKVAIEGRASSLRSRIEQEKAALERTEERSRKLREEQAHAVPVSAYHRFTYLVFVIGSLLVAALTAWYYTNMQGQLAYLNEGRDKFDLLSFVMYEGGWIYAFGAVVLLLAGKTISLIHGKLGHPRWLFITIALLAVTLAMGSGTTLSVLSGRVSELNRVKAVDMSDIATAMGGAFADPCSTPEAASSPGCKDRAAAVERRKQLEGDVRGFDVPMKILIILAEIFMGGVAWMLASEYHEKRGPEQEVRRNRLLSLQQEADVQRTKVEELRGQLTGAERDRAEADVAMNTLETLQAKLPDEAHIHHQSEIILQTHLSRADVVLARVESDWASSGQQGSFPHAFPETAPAWKN